MFSRTKCRGIAPSLTTIATLCKIYNQPELAYPTIHVAGTNGKGSVCTKIATSLVLGGYRIGLYTSPHIASFRERIRVNGEMISETDTCEILSDILYILDTQAISATFFEISTLLAFLYFRKREVDASVIETGLGGTWDATNVVRPLISVITSIGYDHMDILGSTLEQIAKEKAGIIKEGAPVVIGPDVPKEFMQSFANRVHTRLYQNPLFAKDYDVENSETARLVVQLISKQFPLSNNAVSMGLTVKPPCRFELFIGKQTIIFDIAHNIHGIERLLEKLSECFPKRNYRFLVGFSKGKDIQACAGAIETKACAVHIVSGQHPRLASLEEIIPYFTPAKAIPEPSIQKGLHNCLRASESDVLVITGSFFIMHEARKAVGIQEPEDPSIWYDPYKLETVQK